MTNIVFVGAGSMAEAIIHGLLEENKVSPDSICVMNKSDQKHLQYLQSKYQIDIMCSEKLALQKADIVFLAMKPKDAIDACKDISLYINKTATIVSVIAGVSIQTIESYLGERPIARVMPNTSASVGLSASALCCNDKINDLSKKVIINLLESIGTVMLVEEEDMHVVTALSGSGPAYLYYFAEQFEAAAVLHGLSKEDARQLFFQTMKGAAHMLMNGSVEPAELRRKVTSPGGTTEAGIEQLMSHKVDEAIFACIDAAQQKSRILGKQYE
ncbi:MULTISPECIES: pyrroline-5-carboxylate reductase [unclassified Psychrobacillus]|uniref:pyrroline-5-carboxylate reductase n=1 Tax=unclassified Psychrobacillus TaxID=2636677 RepID=UPI00146DAB28|nr:MULTISPECIES: pyrroline-5-carboxylate reductase [unclassified Psychrobacillus]MCM3357133.1 pyrroline-5-carboxylate reductase [Psychrobacillus sp. MER TA 171]NME04450.1 pyrroline-5-carboxylate reductase [Psychrobacillus sp. BL-248-WT-3]